MKLKAITEIVLTSLLMGMLTLVFNVQPVVADGAVDWWPMFRHDLSHTGYSTSKAPNTNNTIWTYRTGDMVGSSPAVADGMVYVGSHDGKVYALNATTGALKWSYTTGRVSSSPAVADGMVYVGSSDSKVYALNATTGAHIWNYTLGGRVYLSSPAVADGKVFVGSAYDYKVYCLNATTGAFIWSYTTGWNVLSSPAVADGIVFVGSFDEKVYAFGPPVPYNVVIKAYCYTEGAYVSVSITMDGTPTGFNTPYTFTGLTGTHTFTVPSNDPNGHPFKQWSTGQTSTTITVSSAGTYTAYYGGAPPPVGGIWVPVDKFVLLAPYIALASTIVVATAATAIYVKRGKKKQ